MSAGERHKELNLAQLFSDVSRTLSGFRRLLIPKPEAARATAQNDASPLSDLGSSIFSDNVCIKPCGMEDIQIAAQKAGDLFVALRYCIIILTVIALLCMISLSLAFAWYLFRTTFVWNRRPAPSIGSAISEASIFSDRDQQKTPSSTLQRENSKK